MTYLVIIFLGISFFIALIKELFTWTYLAQTKKYSLKSIASHFFSHDSLNTTLALSHLIKILFLLLISLLLLATPLVTRGFSSPQIETFTEISLWIISIITLLIFLYDSYLFFEDLYKKTFLRPKFSWEITLLFGTSGFASLLIALIISENILLFSITSILITLLTGLIIVIPIILAKPFILIWSKYTKAKALKKIRIHKKLVTILICGSSRKQFTKSFISQILKSQYKTLTNPYHKNTKNEIFQTIKQNLEPEHDILILDLDPFSKKEVVEITKALRPDIGIITQVDETRLNIFKKTENTLDVFLEMFRNMPAGSLKIADLDNSVIQKNISKLEGETFFYTLKPTDRSQTLFPSRLSKYSSGSSLELSIGETTLTLNPPFASRDELSSLLCAVLVAVKAQIPKENIEKKADELKSPEGLLDIIETPQGDVIIDNTESTNHRSLLNAVNFSLLYPEYEKIIIFKDFLELGKQSKNIHEDLLVNISKNADLAIFTGKVHKNIFKDKLPNVLAASKPTRIEYILKEKTHSPRIVVITGKNNKKVLKLLNTNP